MDNQNPVQAPPIDPAPVSPPVNSKSILSNKLFLPVVVLLVFFFGGSGFLILNSRLNPQPPLAKIVPTSAPTPTPTPTDETANWKTYANSKYKYSLKYPNDWDIIENDDNLIIAPQENIDTLKNIPPVIGVDGGIHTIIIEYSDQNKIDPLLPNELWTVRNRNIQLAGHSVTEYETTITQDFPGGAKGDILIDIYFNDTKKGLSIELKNGRHKGTFDQILSTFKFTQ